MNKKLEKSRSSFKSSPDFLVGFFALKRHSFKKHFLKPISLILVFTFSYTQILWAADVRQMLLNAKASFEDDTRRGGTMSATDLGSAQTSQQAAVAQQAALQDLQNMNFSLTTKNGDILKYVGDTLSRVTRPDGTQLKIIQVDASGNIVSADLKLSDGSIQIFQNGQVIGYGTPDGSTVVYSGGQIQKVTSKAGVDTLYTYNNKDANGNLIETVLDNPSYTTKYDANNKLKEVYEKATGSRTTYSNGIIQKTVKLDGSQILYNSLIQSNGDMLVTPRGSSSASTYTDAQGNIFTFTSGNVSNIKLTDGSTLDSITWDANAKIDSANLTQTDGSKYIYQNKQLARSIDPANVVTNYTYTSTNIVAASAGNTWTYDLNKNPISYADLLGNVTTYLTTGTFKGLKDRDILSTGQTFIYEYTKNADGSIKVFYNVVPSPPSQPTQTVLPVSTLDTSSRALGWVAGTDKSLENDNSNRALEYAINLQNGGDLKIDLNAINNGSLPIPASYTNFNINIFIDGVSQGTFYVPASTSSWKSAQFILKNVTKGAHTLKMVWTNDYWVSGSYDANFRFKDLKFTEISNGAPPVPVVTGDYLESQGQITAEAEHADATTTASGKSWALSGGNLVAGPDTGFNINSNIEATSPRIDFKVNFADTGTYYLWVRGYAPDGNSDSIHAGIDGVQVSSAYRISNFSYGAYSWTRTDMSGAVTKLTVLTTGEHTINFWMREDGFQFDKFMLTKDASFVPSGTGPVETQRQAPPPATSSALQATALTARVDTVKNLTIVKPSAPVTNPTDFLSITYGSDSKLKQIIKTDNSKYIFTNGLLTQALDPQGNPANFNFTESALSNITGSTITQNSLDSHYDASGRLSDVTLNNMTIHYKSDSNTVDFIEKRDDADKTKVTTLSNLTFGDNGNMQNATVITPEGEKRIYELGQLKSLNKPDKTEIDYGDVNPDVNVIDWKPLKLITPDTLHYSFDYTTQGVVQAVLDPSIVPSDATTPIKMQYDTSFNLTKVIRQNQEILNYSTSGSLTSVSYTDTSKTPQVFHYKTDGKTLDYIEQGNIQTFYDANNEPLKSIITPTADNPNRLIVTYQYGKIRQITKSDAVKGDVVTFNYTYTFDSANNEITQIDDLEENAFKTYQGGNLTTSLDKNTQVLSSYDYSNAKVSQVTVARLRRTLHTYNYSYNADLTIVTDEENVTRTYDKDKKLLYLEKNGQKFKYTYTTVTNTVQSGTQQTVLPVGLYDTTTRSTQSNGSQSWYSWGKDYGDNYLVTYWGNQWVDYAVNMTGAGSLKIDFEAINDGSTGPPPGYPGFQIEILVDGASQGVTVVPALQAQWTPASILLQNLTTGNHAIRVKWLNDAGGPNGTDANFKFRNLKMTQSVLVYQNQNETITQEELIEKKLPDDSVAHYSAGKLVNITRPDSSVISDLTLDSNGQMTQGTVTLSGGIKKVFNGTTILEEIDTDGTHFYFSDNKISKVTDSSGNNLIYSYDKDAQGNIQFVWVKTAGTNLKYAIAGNLLGLKLDGVLTPQEILDQTKHDYSGTNVNSAGALSADGNIGTAYTASQHTGNNSTATANVNSDHAFPVPVFIQTIYFKATSSASSDSYYSHSAGSGQGVYYKQVGDTDWRMIAETYRGNGGDPSSVSDDTTYTVNLPNVIAIRGYAQGGSSNSGGKHNDGQSNADACIYEIQYTVADQTNLSFSKSSDNLGNTTGYSFQGYPGSINYDAQGNLLATTTTGLSTLGQAMARKTSFFNALPYYQSNLILPASPDLPSWFSEAKNSILESQTVVSQEYSSQGVLETQSKADGTVTLFDNNKPSEVLDSNGVILIQYSYDADGNPSRVYLKNARDTLPKEFLKAKSNIEDSRIQSLLELYKQKASAKLEVEQQVESLRAAYQNQLDILQNKYNEVSGIKVSGKKAKSQRGDVLNNIGQSMNNVRGAIGTLYTQKADALIKIEDDATTLSGKIEEDSKKAFDRLAIQEANLKNEILTQEVSPIVYDYYRRILGRDPSSAEYAYWINKIDYDSDSGLLTSPMRFNGSSDFASIPDSDDFSFGQGSFTVDFWVNFKDLSGEQDFFGQIQDANNWFYATAHTNGQGSNIVFQKDGTRFAEYGYNTHFLANTWYHIAYVRPEGSDIQMYVNGTQQTGGTLTSAAAKTLPNYAARLAIGTREVGGPYINGYLDGFRVSKGTARWTSNFIPPSSPYKADANAVLLLEPTSTGKWIDGSFSSHDANMLGNPVLDNTQRHFGSQNSSITLPTNPVHFGGNGDYLSVPDSPDFDFSGGFWTVDSWIYPTSFAAFQFIAGQGTDTNNRIAFQVDADGTVHLYIYTASVLVLNVWTAPGVITLNNWQHVAFVENGNNYYIFVNGVQVGFATDSPLVHNYTGTFDIGASTAYGPANFAGYIDGFRVSKGIARWTSNFTPLKAPYIPDQNTSLLLGTDSRNYLIDQSPSHRVISTYGNVLIDTTRPHFPGKVLQEALSESINALPELTDRTAYVHSIKFAVMQKILAYLSLSSADKTAFISALKLSQDTFTGSDIALLNGTTASTDLDKSNFLSSLGLSTGELVGLTASDAQKILTWLNSRSLHFGQSAFLALESLLDQKGITYTRTDLAQKAILIDVLTGVISPLDDGDLVISVYALNKVASLYKDANGNSLSLSGANLSWDDLQAIYQGNPTARVIAHINGNHYVVITGMTSESITYIDPGIGADKHNESLTVTKAGFLKAWQGNVTLESSKLQTLPNYQTKVLSASQTQKIRGAFWGSILSLIGSVLSWIPIPGLQQIGWILTAISTVVAAVEGDFITAIGNIVTLGFNSIVGAFKTAFDGVLKALGPVGDMFRTMGQALNTVYSGVVGFFNSAIGFLPGIGPALQGAALRATGMSLGAQIVNTAISTGLTIGVSKGLESLGVSAPIAGFVGTLVSGGIIGGMSPISAAQAAQGVTQATMIQASVLQTVTLQGVGRLGLQLGLDSGLTNIIGLSLGAMQGNIITNPGTALEAAFNNIKPQLFSSLAQWGVTKLGTSLGIDSRLATALGTPISAGIGAGLTGGVNVGQGIITAINQGIQRGAVSLGLDYLTQQAHLDPLLGSLTARTITGAIEGALSSDHSIFIGIANAYGESTLSFSRLGITGNDAWSQAQYLQRVLNFSDIIKQKGLAQAMEESATQILTEDSVSSILKSFSSIRAFVDDAIQNQKLKSVVINGIEYKKLELANGDYQLFSSDGKNLIEVKRANRIMRGTFGKSTTGEWGLIDGTVIVNHPNGVVTTSTMQGGHRVSVNIYNPNKQATLTITPNIGDNEVVTNDLGDIVNGKINNGSISIGLKAGDVSSLDMNLSSDAVLQKPAYNVKGDVVSQMNNDFITDKVAISYFDSVDPNSVVVFKDSTGQTHKMQAIYDSSKSDYKVITDSGTDLSLLSADTKYDLFLHTFSQMTNTDYNSLSSFLNVYSSGDFSSATSFSNTVGSSFQGTSRDATIEGFSQFADHFKLDKISTALSQSTTVEQTVSYQLTSAGSILIAQDAQISYDVQLIQTVSKYTPLKWLKGPLFALSGALNYFDTEKKIQSSQLTSDQKAFVRSVEWGSFAVTTGATALASNALIAVLGLTAATATAPAWATVGGIVLIGAGFAAASQVAANYFKNQIYKSKGINLNG